MCRAATSEERKDLVRQQQHHPSWLCLVIYKISLVATRDDGVAVRRFLTHALQVGGKVTVYV